MDELPQRYKARTSPGFEFRNLIKESSSTALKQHPRRSQTLFSGSFSEANTSFVNFYADLPASIEDFSSASESEEYESEEESKESITPTAISIRAAVGPTYPDRNELSGVSLFPEITHRKTLVLDLDETLVHAFPQGEAPSSKANLLEMHELLVREEQYLLVLRPGLRKFLEKAALTFELVIFTSGIPEYAHAVRNILDPEGRLFSAVLHRDYCIERKGMYLKDL